jgi:hypothetical protein
MSYSFPILQDVGQLGFERGVSFPGHVKADFGVGFGATAGDGTEVVEFKLTWSGVRNDAKLIVDEDGNTVDRVSYLWNFYRRRMSAMNEPFLVVDITDPARPQYLVQFADAKFSQRQGRTARIYSFSATLRQYRQPGVTLENVDAPNPQQI